MLVNADDSDIGKGIRTLVDSERLFYIYAELRFLQPGRYIGMGIGIHVRIHPQRNIGDFTYLAGDLIKGFEFGEGFHIEHEYSRLESGYHFPRFLTDPGVDDFFGWHSGPQSAPEFTAGHNVRPGTLIREQRDNRPIGVGLD